MHNLFVAALGETPVLKSVLVGGAATVAAVNENDWKIIAIGAAVQVGMAAITAYAATRKPKISRRNSAPRKTKSPDNGANKNGS